VNLTRARAIQEQQKEVRAHRRGSAAALSDDPRQERFLESGESV
jgi:hypothetical protein